MGALDKRLYNSHHTPTALSDCVKLARNGCMSSSAVRLSLSNCTHQLHPCTVLTAASHTHTRPPDVLACISSPQLLSNTYSSLELRSSLSVLKLLGGPRHPHPLEQFIVVDWIGVSPHRFPPPSSKGCSSGRHILFMLFMVLSRSYSHTLGPFFLSVFVT